MARDSYSFLHLPMIAAILLVLVAYEAIRFAEARERIRHRLEGEPAPARPAGSPAGPAGD